MYWSDEGYLLSKSNFDENSIIIEAFTLEHGKHTGIVYGGASRKQKGNFQIGNKVLVNWKSKGENKSGYFNIELIKPISPIFFDDKKKSVCILSATSILKILLPERQINKKIYASFEKMLDDLNSNNWIILYIYWELSLIKELGYETNLNEFSNKFTKVPNLLLNKNIENNIKHEIKEALNFNKKLIIENFIEPNRLRFPLFREILQNYFS
tara:strand:- start:1781 stop:2413 length:633 start_codon:yes stop_codon:yes gene_type:complete